MEALTYLTKSAAILTIFYLVYIIVLRKDTLFSAKRNYFIVGLFSSIALPFLQFEKTIYLEMPTVNVPRAASLVPVISEEVFPVQTYNSISAWDIVSYIYIIGIFIMVSILVSQLYSLLKVIKNNPSNKIGPYTFVKVTEQVAPFSFFKYIVYNPSLHTSEELQMILKHEKVHVTQWHSIDILLANFVRILQWVNPFSWFYKKSLQENLEYLADNQTIQNVSSRTQYQLALVKASSPLYAPGLTNNFYQSFIKKRIVMLNTSTSRKRNLWKLSIVLPALALFLWSFNVKEVVAYTESEKAIENPKVTKSNFYIISSESTDAELDLIEDRLEAEAAPLKVRFSDRERNSENKLYNLTVESKFPDQRRFYKYATLTSEEEKPIDQLKVSIVDGILQFGDTDNKMTLLATRDGLVAESLPDITATKAKEKEDFFGENPLYVINGKEYAKDDLPKNTTLETTGMITAYDKKDGVEKYGEKGKDGVMDISGTTTFKPNLDKEEEEEIELPLLDVKIKAENEGILKEFRFEIDKNTTDAELNKMKSDLKRDHDIDLSYNVKRNSNKQIVSISFNYTGNGNNGSYSASDDGPIEDFFFYVNNDGEYGFWSEAHEERRALREAEREVRREKMVVRREERRADGEARRIEMRERAEVRREEMRGRREEIRERQEEAEEEMHERHEEMREREEEMHERQEEMHERLEREHVIMKEAKERKHRKNYSIVHGDGGNRSVYSSGHGAEHAIIIDKHTTDATLAKMKKNLAAKNITFNYKRVKRNSKGEITAIKIEVNDNKGSKTTSNINGEGDAIDEILIEI